MLDGYGSFPKISSDFMPWNGKGRKKGGDNDLAYCPECKRVFKFSFLEKYRKKRAKDIHYESLCPLRLERIVCNECMDKLGLVDDVVEPEGEKECDCCGEVWPLKDYYLTSKNNGTRRNICRHCISRNRKEKVEKKK